MIMFTMMLLTTALITLVTIFIVGNGSSKRRMIERNKTARRPYEVAEAIRSLTSYQDRQWLLINFKMSQASEPLDLTEYLKATGQQKIEREEAS